MFFAETTEKNSSIFKNIEFGRILKILPVDQINRTSRTNVYLKINIFD